MVKEWLTRVLKTSALLPRSGTNSKAKFIRKGSSVGLSWLPSLGCCLVASPAVVLLPFFLVMEGILWEPVVLSQVLFLRKQPETQGISSGINRLGRCWIFIKLSDLETIRLMPCVFRIEITNWNVWGLYVPSNGFSLWDPWVARKRWNSCPGETSAVMERKKKGGGRNGRGEKKEET